MSSHTCRPGHLGVLADGCDRCAEHASTPMLLSLDADKASALWDKMIAVFHGTEEYETAAEAKAADQLYAVGVWLERRLGIDPWQPWHILQERLQEGLLRQ